MYKTSKRKSVGIATIVSKWRALQKVQFDWAVCKVSQFSLKTVYGRTSPFFELLVILMISKKSTCEVLGILVNFLEKFVEIYRRQITLTAQTVVIANVCMDTSIVKTDASQLIPTLTTASGNCYYILFT